MRHCETCRCETIAEAEARRKREKAAADAKERERDFVRRHSMLTDADVAWARKVLENR